MDAILSFILFAAVLLAGLLTMGLPLIANAFKNKPREHLDHYFPVLFSEAPYREPAFTVIFFVAAFGVIALCLLIPWMAGFFAGIHVLPAEFFMGVGVFGVLAYLLKKGVFE